jgi:hypothetical protein
MSIVIKNPIPHPTQPGVMLNNYAIEELHLVNGSAIDAPASLTVVFRPFVSFEADGITAYLSPQNFQQLTINIPDLFRWISERNAVGDSVPETALGYLLMASGQEYSRR